MATVRFLDSDYRFTTPIRYFKANDPYYWEVDNIPLKQLEENTNWLKDQLTNLKLTDIGRSDFSELKPYVTGEDNVVKVKAGRFSGRVNDVYSIKPLQAMTQRAGEALAEMDLWEFYSSNNPSLAVLVDRFKDIVAESALGMNGLSERAFVYPIRTVDKAHTNYVTVAGGPTVNTPWKGLLEPAFPVSEALTWGASNTGKVQFICKAFSMTDPGKGFLEAAVAENQAIKRWNGVARMALVDVPSELTIPVPAFNEEDFFYLNEKGEKIKIAEAETRIDLVFIYTKPIDVSAITVNKWVNKAPTSISKAELGILHGAGIGISYKPIDIPNELHPFPAIDSQGKSLMLPCVSDQFNTDMGFSGVRGSFPTPEDLLNIAPLLSDELQTEHPMLVGQSILPIAYIAVRRGATKNSEGSPILTDADVIDIRPFFRTTELTYNERAGIVAAIPQLSLVNPAVGKQQLDSEVRRTYLDLNSQIDVLRRIITGGGSQAAPRTVGSGYLFGGYYYGVEGAYIDYLSKKNNGGSLNQLKAEFVKRTGIPANAAIPDYPDWDLAKWCSQGTFTEKGEFPNDYINTHVQRGAINPADFGCFVDRNRTSRAGYFGTENIVGDRGHVCIHFVSKTINFDKSQIPWMADYFVEANLWNCVPLSTRAGPHAHNKAAAASHVWIEKRPTSFTIYVAWVANDYMQDKNEYNYLAGDSTANTGSSFKTPHLNREGAEFAGFAVITEDMSQFTNSTQAYTGESQAGVAIYPSIYFRIVGIPSQFKSHALNLGASNNIVLS